MKKVPFYLIIFLLTTGFFKSTLEKCADYHFEMSNYLPRAEYKSFKIPDSEYLKMYQNWLAEKEVWAKKNKKLIERVKKILLDIAKYHPKVMEDPEPIVLLRGFGESAIKLELRAFVNEKFSLFIQSDLNFEVLKKFSENNIEIPFPKRDVSLTVNEVDLKVLKGQKK